jgi:hypothetical protein
MEEAVEHGGDGGTVTEQLAPVLHRTVGSQQGASPLIAPQRRGQRRGQADLFDLLSRRPSLSALLNFSTTLCREFKGVFSRNPQHDLGALSISPQP